MPNYRRSRVEGSSYFLTLVTHERRPLLQPQRLGACCEKRFAGVRKERPFDVTGIVLLHEHWHLICRLPDGDADADYSGRVSQIKKRFTHSYLAAGGAEGSTTASRRRYRVRGIWEKRFWEHTIRDFRDFVMHLEYIHMNPVKHGLAARPIDWQWSSFGRYVRMGRYAQDWCGSIHLPGTEYIEPW